MKWTKATTIYEITLTDGQVEAIKARDRAQLTRGGDTLSQQLLNKGAWVQRIPTLVGNSLLIHVDPRAGFRRVSNIVNNHIRAYIRTHEKDEDAA